MVAALPDSYGSTVPRTVRHLRHLRFLALWVAALLVVGTAASAAGAGNRSEPRDEVAVGSFGDGAAPVLDEIDDLLHDVLDGLAGDGDGEDGDADGGTGESPSPTTVPELPVEHRLPESVPSNSTEVPAPGPGPTTTTAPPSTVVWPVADPPAPFEPVPDNAVPPLAGVAVGEIPPAHTRAPYIEVDPRNTTHFGADLEVSAPADGGRPGETITVTVRGRWLGARAGSFVIVGPQRFDRTAEEQPRTALSPWAAECGANAYVEPVEQVATFEVPLGPGDEQHTYMVEAWAERCVPSDNGELTRIPVANVQMIFFSRVARPVAPSSPLPTTG